MDLTLTIIEAPQNVNMINHTKVFSAGGGSLGRADDNFWVLPDYDRVVSSRHADISFHDGYFYLTDRSTNGTFHNHREAAIGQDQTITLNHGDLLTVGDYRIKVSIQKAQASAALPKGLQPADFLDAADKTQFTSTLPAAHGQVSQLQDLDDWLEPGSGVPPFGRTAVWGSVSAQVSTRLLPVDTLVPPRGNDPLLALGAAADVPTPASCIDPLAALDQAAAIARPLTPLWKDEDDWWKVGSEDDHAPALTQAMHTPAFAPGPLTDPAYHQPATTSTSSVWDNQPHLQSIAPADVNEAMGILPPDAVRHSQPHPPFTQLSQQPFNQPLHQQPQQHLPSHQVQPAMQPQHAAAVPLPPSIPSPPHAQAQPLVLPEHAPFDQPARTEPAGQGQSRPLTDELATALGLQDMPAEQRELLLPEVAAVVHETINRLMDLLRARSSIKNELRVQRTVIQMLDNNPLKFSVSVRDAIRNMFNSANPAFMSPSDAVSASFDDLSDHQVAVLAGMRAGYETMLKHFDPVTLEKRFNHSRGLLSNKKAKNWDAFEQHYARLKQDGESSYELLFGDSFSAIYEQQLAELTTARNLTRPRG